MILYPNCKINFALRVLRKRSDGYHDLETIFVPIYGLHDELEISASDTFSFSQEGLLVDCPADENLLIRCYRQMSARYPQIGPISIRFKKQIPFGAGLGGGSSDAAHMAIGLNEIFHLGLSKEELAAEVSSLGADCAFFIYNTPCIATGIGDCLHPIELQLQGLRILLVKPSEGVSTREAYSGIRTREDVQRSALLNGSECHLAEAIAKLNSQCIDKSHSAEAIRQMAATGEFVNDFEQTVFPLHPKIEEIKKRLQDAGALYASMSGSGSTVFGLFEQDSEGRSNSGLRLFEKEFASMILLNDTFGQWQS